MNRILAPTLLLVFLFPALALGEEVTRDDLVETNGLMYKKFTNVPFTGTTTGRTQGTYKDGVLDGSYVTYYENGRVYQKGDYKNGRLEGPWVSYHDNGQLRQKGDYKNGEREGPWVYYHDNGELRTKGKYKNGKEEGPWVFYYDNGQLEMKGDLKNRKREGPWVIYNEDGTVLEIWTGTYKNGELVD